MVRPVLLSIIRSMYQLQMEGRVSSWSNSGYSGHFSWYFSWFFLLLTPARILDCFSFSLLSWVKSAVLLIIPPFSGLELFPFPWSRFSDDACISTIVQRCSEPDPGAPHHETLRRPLQPTVPFSEVTLTWTSPLHSTGNQPSTLVNIISDVYEEKALSQNQTQKWILAPNLGQSEWDLRTAPSRGLVQWGQCWRPQPEDPWESPLPNNFLDIPQFLTKMQPPFTQS